MASYDVFTPEAVSSKMISYFTRKVKRLLEPSVGTGNLLTAMKGKYTHADVYDINADYLSAIQANRSITKTCGSFLTAPNKLYDGIILNPPYLRFQEIDSETRKIIRQLSPVLKSGNIDLYVAFLVKCVQCLSDNGTMVAVIPSTWMYNKSCKLFRDFITSERLIHEIHDYGHEKVFPGIDVYCCILVLSKTAKTSYMRNDTEVLYESLVQSPSETLGDIASVQNGIATLCDGVFIHDTRLFDEPCWKQVLKVSKKEYRHIIFPYTDNGVIIPEKEFSEANPQTYEYLTSQRTKLANRDRGNKQYETWYAFGRKQGVTLPSVPQSVYISTLCEDSVPCSINPTTLFYSGIRITPNSDVTCEKVCSFVKANANILKSNCSKRSGGWLNMTVSVLKEVPVPPQT
jgi:adenine-specific DNA-methyltransferase